MHLFYGPLVWKNKRSTLVYPRFVLETQFVDSSKVPIEKDLGSLSGNQDGLEFEYSGETMVHRGECVVVLGATDQVPKKLVASLLVSAKGNEIERSVLIGRKKINVSRGTTFWFNVPLFIQTLNMVAKSIIYHVFTLSDLKRFATRRASHWQCFVPKGRPSVIHNSGGIDYWVQTAGYCVRSLQNWKCRSCGDQRIQYTTHFHYFAPMASSFFF